MANGRSNSPEDSDIFLVKYDRRGTPLGVVSPGGFDSAVQYDAAGRIAAVGQAVTLPASRTALTVTAIPAAKPLAVVEVIRDAYARPVAWNTGGQTLLAASWGEAGTVGESRMLTLSSAYTAALRLIDDFGRVVGIRNPGMGWQTARYDAGNRLVQIIDPRGAVQIAQYDIAGRLLRLMRYSPASRSPEETIVLRWLGNQQIEGSVRDAAGVRRTLWQRDAQGRVVEETQEIALAGQAPVRFVLRRKRDMANESITLSDAGGPHSTLIKEDDDKGRVQRLSLAVALPVWVGGGRSLVKQISWTSVGGTQFAERIAYAGGRTDQWPIVSNTPSATHAVALAKSAPGETRLFRPGGRHDIAGLPGIIETDAGRLILNWDAAGRLAKLGQGETSERFVYDAQGRRVAKIAGKAIRYFAYDGIQLAGEADASGRLLTRYAYLGYRPIAQIVTPQGLWQRVTAWLFGPKANTYSTSKAGRALALYDMSGRVVWQDAEAAGIRRVSLMKALHQPLRDVGQYADDESGLVYHMARFFDPQSGRFLSPDPKGIADAVEHTRPNLLLNAYAYAGGYPDEFFDPDGAAKIRYYAITTGDLGRNKGYGALGMDQGFTKARWAFVIYDIQGGGDSNTYLGKLRNQYAATNTGLLFDGKGNFIGSPADPLTGIANSTKTAIKQEGGISALSKAFVDQYAGNIIGIPQFDIEFDDDNATKLIWYLMGKEEDRVKCKTSAPGWLPEIPFYPGEANIKVTQANANGANQQRILNCNRQNTLPVTYANDEKRRRIEKYEAAAELQESPASSAIYRDCSTNNGCRSATAIMGRYYASYGRTQFVAETFLRTLRDLINDRNTPLTAQERQQLGLNQAVVLPNGRPGTMADMVAIAAQRAKNAAIAYRDFRRTIGRGLSPAQATAAWNALTPQERTDFSRDTGLGQTEFMDMLMYAPNGRARTENEGLNAFGTEAAMRLLDGNGLAVFGPWLMGLYSSQDGYNFISRRFLQNNLRDILAAMPNHFNNTRPSGSDAWRTRQRVIEEELARRVGVLHNSGNLGWATQQNLNALPSYVQGYMNEFAAVAGRGDWVSLRCADDSQAMRDLPGLQMNPLELK